MVGGSLIRVKSRAHLARLAAMIFAYLVAATYPFEWIALNNGAELREHEAIFRTPGALQNRNPQDWISEVVELRVISINLSFESFSVDQRGPARILTISNGPYERNLTIGQEGRDLVFRLRRSTSTSNGLPPYVAPDVFSQPGSKTLNVTIQERSLRAWIDGELVIEDYLPAEPFSSWDADYPVLLGNEPTRNRPWIGKITFAQIETPSGVIDLLSPTSVEKGVPFRPVTVLPTGRDDLLMNFGFFLLFGFLTIGCLSRPSPFLTGTVWFFVCLFAEFLQLFSTERNPNVSDFVLNVFGATAGGYVALLVARDLLHNIRRPI